LAHRRFPWLNLPRAAMSSSWQLARVVFYSLWVTLCHSAQDSGASQLAKHVGETTPAGDIRATLAAFDDLSLRRGFGMHLGVQKGELIELAVGQGLPASGPGVVLETGCHAGDGTLRAIVAMAARQGSTIVSTEDNAEWLAAAKLVVAHATKDLDIKFVPRKLAEDAGFDEFLDKLREEIGIVQFSTIIFDQDQTRFMYQLQALLAKGMLQPGATLYVDNVKTKAHRLRKYLDFVASSSGNGFKTTISDITEPYADAVAISTFVGGDREL